MEALLGGGGVSLWSPLVLRSERLTAQGSVSRVSCPNDPTLTGAVEKKPMDLLRDDELPKGIRYPGPFLRLVERGLTHFEPWIILEGDRLRAHHRGLRDRYPARTLVPFARRQDNDDVACWEAGGGGRVVIVHDFASPGWERRAEFADFYGWLRRAVEDLIEYDSFEEP